MAKLLVVDDEAKIRDILVEFFTRMGFNVIQAKVGEEAIALLKADKAIDLMILDMKMPGSTGIDVLKMKNEMKDERPVILLTGTVSQENIKVIGFSMADDVVYKPFDLFLILGMVKKKLMKKSLDS